MFSSTSQNHSERNGEDDKLNLLEMRLEQERFERKKEKADMESRIQELEKLLLSSREDSSSSTSTTSTVEYESFTEVFLGEVKKSRIDDSDNDHDEVQIRTRGGLFTRRRNSIFNGHASIGFNSLNEDTYTLMILSKAVFDTAWMLGFIIFLSQVTLCGLVVHSQVNDSGNNFSNSTPLDIPIRTKPEVAVLQLFTIFLAVYSQDDMFNAIALPIDLRLNGSHPWGGIPVEDEVKRSYLAWVKRILVPNVMKCFAGTLVLLTSVVVIFQSREIIDLLMNFTALFVISSIDEVMYSVVRRGFFGRKLLNLSKSAEDIDISSAENDIDKTRNQSSIFSNSTFVKSLVLNFFLIFFVSVWAWVLYTQETGMMTRQKYSICTEEIEDFDINWKMLENGECNMIFNNIQCAYDGGDCDAFNALYPNCDVDDATLIADGKCDGYPYNSELCRFDGGDCRKDAIYCDASIVGEIGDGICDKELNTHECLYDRGDCIDPILTCDIISNNGKKLIIPGDGECGVTRQAAVTSGVSMDVEASQGRYSGRESCAYDGGDCVHPRYPGCYFDEMFPDFLNEIGDGICQDYEPYNTEACGWDGGDCINICEVDVSLVFEENVADMAEGAVHNDGLEVWKVTEFQRCSYYLTADYCQHDKKDGAFYNVDDDYYYDLSESVKIYNAAGESFLIYVNHFYTYYEAVTTDKDHEMAGVLYISINGEQIEETWSHDVDGNTHIGYNKYYKNPDYDDSLMVRMTCNNQCLCIFEKVD